MSNFFRKEIPSVERKFRLAVLLWASTFVLFSGSGVIGYISGSQLLLDLTMYPALVFMIYTPLLFLYAVVRAIILFSSKEYDLAVGYLVYAALTGMFTLPMIVGLYDRYWGPGIFL